MLMSTFEPGNMHVDQGFWRSNDRFVREFSRANCPRTIFWRPASLNRIFKTARKASADAMNSRCTGQRRPQASSNSTGRSRSIWRGRFSCKFSIISYIWRLVFKTWSIRSWSSWKFSWFGASLSNLSSDKRMSVFAAKIWWLLIMPWLAVMSRWLWRLSICFCWSSSWLWSFDACLIHVSKIIDQFKSVSSWESKWEKVGYRKLDVSHRRFVKLVVDKEQS